MTNYLKMLLSLTLALIGFGVLFGMLFSYIGLGIGSMNGLLFLPFAMALLGMGLFNRYSRRLK